jgi:hypothetical protein
LRRPVEATVGFSRFRDGRCPANNGHQQYSLGGPLPRLRCAWPMQLRAKALRPAILEEAITLHPEYGMLVAEIAYRAALPLVGNAAENMVAGACFGIELYRMRRTQIRRHA